MSRPIGDAAVDGIFEPPRILVEFGGSIADESAPAKELVKAVEPPQAARLAKVHEFGMDWPADRRFPADGFAANRCLPDTHAASRQDFNEHLAVMNADLLHSFRK